MKVWKKIMMGAWIAALSAILANGMEAEAEVTFTADKRMEGVRQGYGISYDAVKEKNGKLVWNSNAKWDLYAEDTYVDISHVKTTKDVYIAVDTTIYKIEKDARTRCRGKITGSTLTITEGTKELDKTNWGDYQYRTEGGEWTDLKQGEDFSLAPFEQQGATLYFRYKGKPGKITGDAVPREELENLYYGRVSCDLFTIPADSFVGKEFKVKVPKKANAPALSVNYKTGVVKAKKGAEYRVGGGIHVFAAEWADFNENYVIDPYDNSVDVIQMRMKKTGTKGPSKISQIGWETEETMKYGSEYSYLRDIQTNTKAVESGDFIKDALVYTSAKANSINRATFVIENKTDERKTLLPDMTFEFFRTKTVNGKIVADGGPVLSVKPGKKVVLKNSMIPNNTELSVRYAGDKSVPEFPSVFSPNKVKIIYNVEDAAANK